MVFNSKGNLEFIENDDASRLFHSYGFRILIQTKNSYMVNFTQNQNQHNALFSETPVVFFS